MMFMFSHSEETPCENPHTSLTVVQVLLRVLDTAPHQIRHRPLFRRRAETGGRAALCRQQAVAQARAGLPQGLQREPGAVAGARRRLLAARVRERLDAPSARRPIRRAAASGGGPARLHL